MRRKLMKITNLAIQIIILILNLKYINYICIFTITFLFSNVLSEFTPFAGVNSDTTTCLVSLRLHIRLLQKFANFFF